ncbi:hypothetical protein IV203_009593 [Nitzschia inconspicua]|uniref:Uncharacterized protein n=1 Tax=Nitzschia inconspicua TaxID=303405 RepID=A0A9K3PK72_9STRA|nr:hypothetical protein IV203_009593 [Nitzschia inconspicua]
MSARKQARIGSICRICSDNSTVHVKQHGIFFHGKAPPLTLEIVVRPSSCSPCNRTRTPDTALLVPAPPQSLGRGSHHLRRAVRSHPTQTPDMIDVPTSSSSPNRPTLPADDDCSETAGYVDLRPKSAPPLRDFASANT